MSTAAQLERNIDYIVPPNGLQQKLAASEELVRPLRVKLGFDPTAPDLHLGHAVVLRKLRDFQDAGHQIVIIIGDFTARIGDPTGRNSARPPLSAESVKLNAETYIAQLSKVLDISKAEIRWNSEWLEKMGADAVIRLMSRFTLSQIMQRDDFAKRYADHAPIHMHEMLYPLMQGYDSLMIDADIEIGGTDQLFNCQVGRQLQEGSQRQPQAVISMPLLVGLDGKEKMSKSKNNYIGLTDAPEMMYGKAMSIPDSLLPNYLDLATSFDLSDISSMKAELESDSCNPINIKKKIAFNIVEQYYGESAAREAELHFYNQFQNRDQQKKDYKPVPLAEVFANSAQLGIVDLCKSVRPELSKSEIRRLIASQAVRLNFEKVTNPDSKVEKSGTDIHLQIGKTGFFVIRDMARKL